jgi:hypothetical protein
MNERIKQLAEQAFFDESTSRPSTKMYTFSDHKMEKFAQLIVQECITIVDEQKECLHEEQKYWHDRDYGYALAVDDASKGIKQFFGVEE